jgi:hypothetical protein
MAKKAKKKKRARKTRGPSARQNHYFYIKCNKNGLIVGAWSPDEDLCGTVRDYRDIVLRNNAKGVYIDNIDGIRFDKCDEHAPCVWRKVNNQWKCV